MQSAMKAFMLQVADLFGGPGDNPLLDADGDGIYLVHLHFLQI